MWFAGIRLVNLIIRCHFWIVNCWFRLPLTRRWKGFAKHGWISARLLCFIFLFQIFYVNFDLCIPLMLQIVFFRAIVKHCKNPCINSRCSISKRRMGDWTTNNMLFWLEYFISRPHVLRLYCAVAMNHTTCPWLDSSSPHSWGFCCYLIRAQPIFLGSPRCWLLAVGAS